MVRSDEFFLKKWVSYYGERLGKENLYIFFDGKDQEIPSCCEGTNAVLCDRVAGNVARADKGRIRFLSKRAEELFERYDIVIGTDVDEFLVVDPDLGLSLPEYLSSLKIKGSVSGLGIDVGQNLNTEQPIDPSRPFLEQRTYGYLSSRYTKTNTLSEPIEWGSGFHRVEGHQYHIDPNLYLFHFGCIDFKRLQERIDGSDRIANGWSAHLKRRARTIRVITNTKPGEWDKLVPLMRWIQVHTRAIHTLNKPTTLGLKLVVRIPEKFHKIL